MVPGNLIPTKWSSSQKCLSTKSVACHENRSKNIKKIQVQVDFQLHFVEDMSLFFVVMCPAHAFL